MEIEASRWNKSKSLLKYSKLEEIAYMKNFPECFRGQLKTLWRDTPALEDIPYSILDRHSLSCKKLEKITLFGCLHRCEFPLQIIFLS